MYKNYRKVMNTNSGIVHGVRQDVDRTFCGYPDENLAGGINWLIEVWYNWEEVDGKTIIAEEATCHKCRLFLQKRGVIE